MADINKLTKYDKEAMKWIKFLSIVSLSLSAIVLIFYSIGGGADFKTSNSPAAILLLIAILAANLLIFFVPILLIELHLFGLCAFVLGIVLYGIYRLWRVKRDLAVRLYCILYFGMVILTIFKTNGESELSSWPMIISFLLWAIPLIPLTRAYLYKQKNKLSN